MSCQPVAEVGKAWCKLLDGFRDHARPIFQELWYQSQRPVAVSPTFPGGFGPLGFATRLDSDSLLTDLDPRDARELTVPAERIWSEYSVQLCEQGGTNPQIARPLLRYVVPVVRANLYWQFPDLEKHDLKSIPIWAVRDFLLPPAGRAGREPLASRRGESSYESLCAEIGERAIKLAANVMAPRGRLHERWLVFREVQRVRRTIYRLLAEHASGATQLEHSLIKTPAAR